MGTYATKGIVIGRTNLGEADRIVRLFTLEHGKLSAIAKGVRKIKSRAGGHIEPFGEVSLMVATGRSLDVITSARLAWYPHALIGHMDRLDLAFIMAKAVDRLTEPGQALPSLYEVLREGLGALDQGTSGALLELWFKLRLLDVLGYRPELGHCLVCGEQAPEAEYAFSAERGGIVCHRDASPLDLAIRPTAIKLWRLLSDYPFATVAHIAGGEELAARTLPLCEGFYDHHLGQSFRH